MHNVLFADCDSDVRTSDITGASAETLVNGVASEVVAGYGKALTAEVQQAALGQRPVEVATIPFLSLSHRRGCKPRWLCEVWLQMNGAGAGA